MVVMVLVGCTPLGGAPGTTPTTAVSSQPSGGLANRPQPPAAWLSIGVHLYPATAGSFCYQGGCVDMVPPEMMPDLATATVPPAARPVIHISAIDVVGLEATVRPWPKQPPVDASTARRLQAHGERQGAATLYTLEPIGAGREQLLMAAVRFAQGGDASYFWRLNPTK